MRKDEQKVEEEYIYKYTETCPICRGKGRVSGGKICKTCDGVGRIPAAVNWEEIR